MNAITKFKADLQDWLVKNGFEKLDFAWALDFGYGVDSHEIHIGVQAFPEISAWFEEFLIENGCLYEDIIDPVKCFLHELGHHMTNYKFTDEQLVICSWLKTYDEGVEELNEKDFLYHYWQVPDEMSANMWAIDFINEHIDAVCDLIDIYCEDWNNIVNEYDVFELVGKTL